jgi:zinc protease
MRIHRGRNPGSFLLMTFATSILAMPARAGTGSGRAAGPAGSLVMVDEALALPLVWVTLAARSGSASDPRGKEGLAYLAAELARRGAAGRSRAALDDALDALGASLAVDVDQDSIRFSGQVLARNLDPFLDLLADVVLRPDFSAEELGRTRKEIVAQIDEVRNDDQALCARFFEPRLYGEHPYGRAPEGTARSLTRIGRDDIRRQHHRTFVGPNLVFAAAGGITLDDFRQRLASRFQPLHPGPAPDPTPLPAPVEHEGWRLQIVDKPERQQTQIMFGHPSVPATHPDRHALTLALASFGGRAMSATLMDEVRTKRGLAYGAYMNLAQRRGPGALRGWVFTSVKRTVTTLKLVLRLYRRLRREGMSEDRLRFFQNFVAGAHAADMDDPARRLDARVTAETRGLPPDEVDSFSDRIRAVSPAEVRAALERHLAPDHIAITLVATAAVLRPLLLRSGIAEGAIDVVAFDSY